MFKGFLAGLLDRSVWNVTIGVDYDYDYDYEIDYDYEHEHEHEGEWMMETRSPAGGYCPRRGRVWLPPCLDCALVTDRRSGLPPARGEKREECRSH
jgi:hypothetical protein